MIMSTSRTVKRPKSRNGTPEGRNGAPSCRQEGIKKQLPSSKSLGRKHKWINRSQALAYKRSTWQQTPDSAWKSIIQLRLLKFAPSLKVESARPEKLQSEEKKDRWNKIIVLLFPFFCWNAKRILVRDLLLFLTSQNFKVFSKKKLEGRYSGKEKKTKFTLS